MKKLLIPVHRGDGINTFNISTCSAYLSASGVKVANMATRQSQAIQSADVLHDAGAKLDLSPEKVSKCINSKFWIYVCTITPSSYEKCQHQKRNCT